MKISFAMIMYNDDWEVTEFGTMARLTKDGSVYSTPVVGQWMEGNAEELVEKMSKLIHENYVQVDTNVEHLMKEN